jgi:para-aminobenzoate synthetase / 4-amino-4-deoxychorismate lyase
VPDPHHGVFETLLVIDGRPVELDAHLTRLSASLNELFPGRPAPNFDQIDIPGVSGSLRITVIPVGERLVAQTSFRQLEQRPQPIALHSTPWPGGLGAHKWADRAWLDEAQLRLGADALPLIVDADGAVLEASRANLFAVRDGALFTPPADGRILPGITRARVLQIAAESGLETRQGKLLGGDLLSADEVFLTGSVRGIERVASVDGTRLAGGGRIAAGLAAELWRSWLGAPVG